MRSPLDDITRKTRLALTLRADARVAAGGRALGVDGPPAVKGEVVVRQLGRRARGIARRARRERPGQEALGPRRCPGRSRAWRSSTAVCALARDDAPRSVRARLPQQRADVALGRVVLALAEVDVADLAASRRSGTWPASSRLPYASQVANPLSWTTGYRSPSRPIASPHVAGVALERELGRVHADDHQAVAA